MIILDTNVVSEVVRPVPSPSVLNWLSRQASPEVYTTTVTLAEVLYGVESMPAGKRRTNLLMVVEAIFDEDFSGRVLPFDEAAARAYAGIVAARDTDGRPISQFDAMIASVALSHRAALATRNNRDFQGCGLTLIDPWA